MPKSKNDEKKLLALYPDHPRPVTRRDFLATGLIGFSGYVMAPSALSLLLNAHKAMADDCPTGISNQIPFMHIEFSGGMALESCFLMGQDGEPTGDPRKSMLDDYSRNGWMAQPSAASAGATAPPAGSWVMDALNYPMRAGSAFTNELKRVCSPAALACTAATTFALFSNADNSNANPFSPMTAISQITQGMPLVGNRSSGSGTNQPSFKEFPYSATEITSATTLISLSSPGSLGRGPLEAIFRAAQKMTRSQSQRLSSMGFNTALSKLMGCSVSTALGRLNARDMNPLDANYTNAQGQGNVFLDVLKIVTNNNVAGRTKDQEVLAAMLMAVLDNGYVGAGYSIGACDIHDNTAGRTLEVNGMTKGAQALGYFLEVCYRRGKRGVAFLSTDGSAYSNGLAGPWQGDLNSATAVMVVIDPARGAGNTKMRKMMLGGYTDGRTAANEQPFSKNPRMVGEIVAANYYYLLNGTLDGFEKIALSRVADLQPFVVVG